MDSTFTKSTQSPENNKSKENTKINFDIIKTLHTSGSTCDTYIARVNGRILFVKRLKEEFRNKPLYLNAFRKEFEVGSIQRHRSLPLYLDYQDDYLCLDYIDGRTLAEMIANCDPWLASKDNIVKLIVEILDVLEYLHEKNVIHCDIKADNIMLTYVSHNLFLIDFDKCYTDSFDNTAGSSRNFGLNEDKKKSPIMDFIGLGKLLEELENKFKYKSYFIKKFIDACLSLDVTMQSLRNMIEKYNDYNERSKREVEFRRQRTQRIKLIENNTRELTPEECQILEEESEYVENLITVYDGPLEYQFNRYGEYGQVRCREDVKPLILKAHIPSPYVINGKNFFVSKIPFFAFDGCYNLKSVIIPDGVTLLTRTTFTDCFKLEYFKIPASVKTITSTVISYSKKLKRVEFENPKDTAISPDFILECNDTFEIVDLSTGISYSYEDFIEKFGKKD